MLGRAVTSDSKLPEKVVEVGCQGKVRDRKTCSCFSKVEFLTEASLLRWKNCLQLDAEVEDGNLALGATATMKIG